MEIKNCKFKIIAEQKGFTLIEILIAMAVFAIIAVVVSLSLSGFKRRQNLEFDAARIAALFTSARGRAISSEGGKRFGVRFSKGAGGQEFYDIVEFETGQPGGCYIPDNPILEPPDVNLVERHQLKSNISFSEPSSEGIVWDIVFTPISGIPDPLKGGVLCHSNTVVITIEGSVNPEDQRTISVNDSGTISNL